MRSKRDQKNVTEMLHYVEDAPDIHEEKRLRLISTEIIDSTQGNGAAADKKIASSLG